MKQSLLSTSALRALLLKLGPGGVRLLSQASGVPAQTIYSIRTGRTKAATLETAGSLMPHMSLAVRASTKGFCSLGRIAR